MADFESAHTAELSENPLWAATGDILYATADDAGAVLTIGDTNEVLLVSGGLPAWAKLPVAGLANGTDGQLITWGTDAAATTVAVGTATHILTSNGDGNPPTFQAAAAGGTSLAVVLALS